jgi:hypothetical protein
MISHAAGQTLDQTRLVLGNHRQYQMVHVLPHSFTGLGRSAA